MPFGPQQFCGRKRSSGPGGGSRSPHWPQIFADGLGVTITVAEARETAALGAAIGAGVGTGKFTDYESGIAAMIRPKAVFQSNAAMKNHCDRRYRVYTGLTAVLGEFWNELREQACTGTGV